jgi:hypothetical protein
MLTSSIKALQEVQISYRNEESQNKSNYDSVLRRRVTLGLVSVNGRHLTSTVRLRF